MSERGRGSDDVEAPDGREPPDPDHEPDAPDPENEPDPPDPADVPVDVAPSHRRRLNVTVLMVLAGLAVVALSLMILPFLGGLGAALVVAVMAFPRYRRFRDWTGRPSLSALLATIVLFLGVLLPLAGLSVALVASVQDNAESVAEVGEFLEPEGSGDQMLDSLASRVGAEDPDLVDKVRMQVREAGTALTNRILGFLSGLGALALQTGVALFTLYYFLRDGEMLMDTAIRVIPVDPGLAEALAHRSAEVIRATMFGNVAVGVAQGVLLGLTFWALGIPGPVLWGTVMVILGMLPLIGSPVVWAPAAVILVVQGEPGRAAILVVVGLLIIGTVDNILRAQVVGERAQLHPLGVFVSVLGGVALFGLMGLFLGPLVFVLSMSLLEVMHGVLQPDDGLG